MASPCTSLGSRLADVTPLTALISSTTAESLILGSRGAAGMPWAAMSAIGSIVVIKASLTAAVPGWLRHSLGLQNARFDADMGLEVDMARLSRIKRKTESALAVMATRIKISEAKYATTSSTDQVAGQQFRISQETHHAHVLYAINDFEVFPLRACSPAAEGNAVPIFEFARDYWWEQAQKAQVRRDWFAIASSVIKLSEVAVLIYYGADGLWWITALNWMFFIGIASLLQLFGLARDYGESYTQGTYKDILAGNLPTVRTVGDGGKVLLNMPLDRRKTWPWRAAWVIGAVLAGCTVVATYVNLSSQSSLVVYIWFGFQLAWLALRSIFFYWAEENVATNFTITQIVPKIPQPPHYSLRLLTLLCALSQYQAASHPRGLFSYTEDAHSPELIARLLAAANWRLTPTFSVPEAQPNDIFSSPQDVFLSSTFHDAPNDGTLEVNVEAVIGDTLLSSVSWLYGHPVTGMNLYDSCLVVLRVNDSVLLVPASRVLMKPNPQARMDVEKSNVPLFLPRGSSASTTDGMQSSIINWLFWIPSDGDRWLFFKSDQLHFLGKQRIRVMTSEEVTKRLQVGDFLISLDHVCQVKDIATKSAEAGQLLCDLCSRGTPT